MTKKKTEGLSRSRTAFEMVILFVAIVAITTIVGGLGFYAFTFKTGPADLQLAVLPDEQKENTFVIRVNNRGGTTAEDVIVEVASEDESHDVEFKVVAKGGAEEAVVEMQASSPPKARIKTYKEP